MAIDVMGTDKCRNILFLDVDVSHSAHQRFPVKTFRIKTRY